MRYSWHLILWTKLQYHPPTTRSLSLRSGSTASILYGPELLSSSSRCPGLRANQISIFVEAADRERSSVWIDFLIQVRRLPQWFLAFCFQDEISKLASSIPTSLSSVHNTTIFAASLLFWPTFVVCRPFHPKLTTCGCVFHLVTCLYADMGRHMGGQISISAVSYHTLARRTPRFNPSRSQISLNKYRTVDTGSDPPPLFPHGCDKRCIKFPIYHVHGQN